MKPPELPANERERLAKLYAYDVLDSEPELAFDEIVKLASHICDTPIALVSLVDAERQWFKARVGVDATETPRNISFCGHAVADGSILVVPDTHLDERFADNPLVAAAPDIRFYAGAPLITPEDYAIGTLCIIDRQPRRLEPAQREMLEALARQVVSQLELRRMLREVREQQRARHLFFDVSLDLLCIAGADGFFKELNPAWQSCLGRSLEELMSRPFLEFVHHDDRERTAAEAAAVAHERHRAVDFECRFLTKDGDVRWLQWRARAAPGTSLMFAAARDVTRQREAAQELAAAHAAAQSANQAKSAFLANMSHELRTPLNSVIGFSNILAKNKQGNLEAAQLDFVERIANNGKHLLSLLDDILDLSKVESGRFDIELEDVDLPQLIAEVATQLDGLLREHGAALSLSVPAGAKKIRASSKALGQVLINLLGNATKFSQGGTVGVRLVLSSGGDPLRLDVVDDGVGIAEDKLELIFEPFRQAESSTSRRFGGSGLGLTISRTFARAMGFDIAVASRVGDGATFSIVFDPSAPPVEHAPPAANGAAENPGAAPSSLELATTETPVGPDERRAAGTVLVIDDDVEARTLIERLVEELGYNVVAAGSGARGLEIARAVEPSLITVDLMMPEMDGFAVIKALEDDERLRHIPVVVCSIVAGEKRASLARSISVVDKPVDKGELARALERYGRAGRTRVLVIDADEDARRLLSDSLQQLGADVRLAESGQQGLDALEAELPDFVLLDLSMPDVDGFAVLRRMRQTPRLRDLPVIVCTARPLSDSEERRLAVKAQAVISKGATLQRELADIVEEVLRGVRQ